MIKVLLFLALGFFPTYATAGGVFRYFLVNKLPFATTVELEVTVVERIDGCREKRIKQTASIPPGQSISLSQPIDTDCFYSRGPAYIRGLNVVSGGRRSNFGYRCMSEITRLEEKAVLVFEALGETEIMCFPAGKK